MAQDAAIAGRNGPRSRITVCPWIRSRGNGGKGEPGLFDIYILDQKCVTSGGRFIADQGGFGDGQGIEDPASSQPPDFSQKPLIVNVEFLEKTESRLSELIAVHVRLRSGL